MMRLSRDSMNYRSGQYFNHMIRDESRGSGSFKNSISRFASYVEHEEGTGVDELDNHWVGKNNNLNDFNYIYHFNYKKFINKSKKFAYINKI